MISLVAGIVAAVSCVLMTNGIFYRYYTVTKRAFLCSAVCVLFLWWGLSGQEIHVSAGVLLPASFLCTAWILSTALSTRFGISMRQLLPHFCGLFLGLVLLPGLDGRTIAALLVGMATVNAAVAILENVFHVVVFNKIKPRKKFEPAGMVGNPNHLAAYLAPHVFLSAYLIHQGAWWAVPCCLVILWALWRTKCRAAFLGLLGAGIFALFLFRPLGEGIYYVLCACVPVGLAHRHVARVFNSHTLRERINYWRVAWEQIRRTPLTGIGFDVFRVVMPKLQRDINKRTGGRFLQRKNYQDPWPEAVHSDPLQVLTDHGLNGFAPFAWVLAAAIGAGISGNGPELWLAVALAAMTVNGLFFHSLYVLPCNVVFWALIGLCARSPAPWCSSLPTLAIVLTGGVLAALTARFIVRRLRVNYWLRQLDHPRPDKENVIRRILALDVENSLAQSKAVTHCWKKGNMAQAFTHAVEAIEHNDGRVMMTHLYTNLGYVFFQVGAPALADAAFNEAQSYIPWNARPAIAKAQLAEARFRVSLAGPAKKEAAHGG